MPDTWSDQDLRDEEAHMVDGIMGRIGGGWFTDLKKNPFTGLVEAPIRDESPISTLPAPMGYREAVIRLRILADAYKAGRVAVGMAEPEGDSFDVSRLEMDAVAAAIPMLETVARAIGVDLPDHYAEWISNPACTSTDPTNHQGDTCSIHEEADRAARHVSRARGKTVAETWVDGINTPTPRGLDPGAMILDEVRSHTGRQCYYENSGGGMVYLMAELNDAESYTWLGWTDGDYDDYGLADLSIIGSAVKVNGCLYRVDRESNSVDPSTGMLPDEPVGPDGLIPAILRFIDNATAAANNPDYAEWC